MPICCGAGSPKRASCPAQENMPIAQHLLEMGAAVDDVSIHLVTPFFAAAAKGNLPFVRLLVQAGCNINIPAQNGCVLSSGICAAGGPLMIPVACVHSSGR